MLTLTDLQNKLKLIDEISLMEVLEITSEDLVQRFLDKIEEKQDMLSEDFEEDDCDECIYSGEGYDEGNEWWE